MSGISMFKESLLKKALSIYARKHILERVLQYGEGMFSREGKSNRLTLMFIEIASFDSQSAQSFAAQRVADVVNSSLATIFKCISDHNGVVDNFTGSMVFAYWGLNEGPGHEIKAARCAHDCVVAVAERSKKNQEAGLPVIKVRIGVNTGDVFVGNIGSDQRMKRTVLGDHVNLASSLTGMCVSYPDTQILITEFTAENLDNSFSLKKLGNVKVKGREDAVGLYTFQE